MMDSNIYRDLPDFRLTANYHTHTRRCGHASGEDREYVENAIKAGIKYLGFSDHTPYPTGTGFVSGMRMSLAEADGYFSSIESLRKEYKNDIVIYAGVEAEYFPEHFEKLTEFMSDYPLDYMIMGEHFVPDEEYGVYVGGDFADPGILREYADNVIAGIKTGNYAYIAHPDLPRYFGRNQNELMTSELSRICACAKEYHIPLEINVLGLSRGLPYPSDRLCSLAKKYENDVIIGIDAHTPKAFHNTRYINEAFNLIQKHNLNLIDRLEI